MSGLAPIPLGCPYFAVDSGEVVFVVATASRQRIPIRKLPAEWKPIAAAVAVFYFEVELSRLQEKKAVASSKSEWVESKGKAKAGADWWRAWASRECRI